VTDLRGQDAAEAPGQARSLPRSTNGDVYMIVRNMLRRGVQVLTQQL
jgi:hypothetical protein